jgi:3-phenylpropionate/trans-cinnamate dioxygenase ferredoxin component
MQIDVTARLQNMSVGELRRCEIAGRALCAGRAEDGEIYFIDDTCTHEEASLSEGDLFGFEVECPLHGAVFDIRTGDVKCLPATLSAQVFPLREDGGRLLLELENDGATV